MKILQVNCVYNKGSTGKLIHDIHCQLQNNEIDSVVCYGRGAKTGEPDVHKVCPELYAKFQNLLTRFTGIMYGGCALSTAQLISRIRAEKPDVVHLQCINGYFVNIYRLLNYLKKQKIPTVVTLHAEFMYTANCGHADTCEKWRTGCGNCPRLRKETGSLLFDRTGKSWERMKKAFAGSENIFIITSVSPWLRDRAMQSPMLKNHQHRVVCNGIDTEVFKPVFSKELYDRYNPDGKKLILHVTARFKDPNKGGRHVLDLAKRLGEEYRILLVGNGIPEQKELPSNVVRIGPVSDCRLLAELYTICDVTVLTSKKETFSMICPESLCCNTPVVGFCAGGPEQIALPDFSGFCAHGNMAELEKLTREWAARPKDDGCRQQAVCAYHKKQMVKNYLSVYREVLAMVGGKT